MSRRRVLLLPLLAAASWGVEPRAAELEAPDLVVSLTTDRPRYYRMEPIRLIATVRIDSGRDLAIHHPPGEDAARVDFFLSGKADADPLVGSSRLAYQHGCGYVGDRPRQTIWTLRGDRPLTLVQWLDNLHEAGESSFRATFTILAGPHAGRSYRSDPVTVSVMEPFGRNREAYDYVRNRPRLRCGDAWCRMDERSVGMFPRGGSHHARAIHEHFLDRFGDTLYADYVRFTVASYTRPPYEALPLYEETIRRSRLSFPLRADAYVELLRAEEKRLGAEGLLDLRDRILAEELSIAHEPTRLTLRSLTEEAPATAERIRRRRAEFGFGPD